MKDAADKARTELQDRCADIIEHVNLLRDFATTPGNSWLAKDELSKISQLTAEIDKLLAEIGKD